MVKDSLKPGKYSEKYTQFDTIRQFRSTLFNYQVVDSYSKDIPYRIASEGSMFLRFTSDTSSSMWLGRFTQGCRRRMGQNWRPDRALSTKLVIAVLEEGRKGINTGKSLDSGVADLVPFCSYIVVCYILSLRGPEGRLLALKPLTEQEGLESLQEEGDTLGKSILIIPLLGKVKGETHRREHILPCVEKTSSGINVRNWMNLLLEVRALTDQKNGPAITKSDGVLFTTSELNEIFHELLWEVFQTNRNLFATGVKTKADIEGLCNVFRSLQRTSDSRSLAKGVSP